RSASGTELQGPDARTAGRACTNDVFPGGYLDRSVELGRHGHTSGGRSSTRSSRRARLQGAPARKPLDSGGGASAPQGAQNTRGRIVMLCRTWRNFLTAMLLAIGAMGIASPVQGAIGTEPALNKPWGARSYAVTLSQ